MNFSEKVFIIDFDTFQWNKFNFCCKVCFIESDGKSWFLDENEFKFSLKRFLIDSRKFHWFFNQSSIFHWNVLSSIWMNVFWMKIYAEFCIIFRCLDFKVIEFAGAIMWGDEASCMFENAAGWGTEWWIYIIGKASDWSCAQYPTIFIIYCENIIHFRMNSSTWGWFSSFWQWIYRYRDLIDQLLNEFRRWFHWLLDHFFDFWVMPVVEFT